MLSLLPKIQCKDLPSVTPDLLKKLHIRVLLMDFDNTIVPYTKDTPAPEVAEWLLIMRHSGISLCIVSNTKRGRAVAFAEKHGIPCITAAKKPFQKGINRAKEMFPEDIGHIALVGDQIYTDTLGANMGGLLSILIKPIHLHTIWLWLRHVAELPWIGLGRIIYGNTY